LLALRDVGGVDALGLVEQDVEPPGLGAVAEADALAVDFDGVLLGVDEHGQVADDLAVHGDAAVEDHLLDVAAGVDAGVGEDLLDALLHCP
jgi:hypothetical protein